MTSNKQSTFAFMRRWVLFSMLGWIAGAAVAMALGGLLTPLVPPGPGSRDWVPNLLLGPAIGAAVAFVEWRWLRRSMQVSGFWVWAGVIGFAVPLLAAPILELAGFADQWLGVGLLLGGVLTGIMQTPLLKSHAPKPIIWMWANTLAWTFLAFVILLTDKLRLGWIGLLLAMIVFGVATGFGFLKISKPEGEAIAA